MRALNFDVALEKRRKQHQKISSAAFPRLTSALCTQCIVISWAVFATALDCQCGLLNLRHTQEVKQPQWPNYNGTSNEI